MALRGMHDITVLCHYGGILLLRCLSSNILNNNTPNLILQNLIFAKIQQVYLDIICGV